MTQSHDDRGQSLQQADRCWCLYVADQVADNFKLAREQGVWGAEKAWFGSVRKGDRVLFVHHLSRWHESIRSTPAMALGIADHIWSIGELVDAALYAPVPTPLAPRPSHRRG